MNKFNLLLHIIDQQVEMVKKNDQLVDGTTSEDVNNLLHVNIIAAIDLFAMSMRK